MADEGIFATTLQVQNKAGANASSVSNTEVYINDFMLQAESEINSTIRYNFSDNYGTLNTDVKSILTKVSAAMAATEVLNFDLSEMSQREAETRLDVLNNQINRGMAALKRINVQTFMLQA
jgi:hypothetical protein